ncbi:MULTISPECIES: CsbD family protein [unclassified Sphingomonas]|uniref:CsbD family protein n=1 Tax=unclassified Sphingomonas TaxID=196159 RepID=UPI0006FC0A5C|nr:MULTISPECIES: CsbD family protein [unclassified Sphingomonas]KQS51433.1 general stress protein CsbD [Sphingomonas sp. Leaf198]
MNSDTITGTTSDLGGKLKEGLGNAIGDKSLQTEGAADQLSGTVQKTYGQAKDAVEENIRPVIDYVRQFSKERPFTAAAVAGVLGIALINTLRGK